VTVPSTGTVAVVTPWYPTLGQPFRGAFVRAAVEATAPTVARMTVFHCDDWAQWVSRREGAAIERAYRAIVPGTSRPIPTAGGAGLIYLPVPIRAGLGFGEIARHHAAVLRDSTGGNGLDADVVHAHVGLPAGWAAIKNARPDARVFVTEHATFLNRVLAQAEARSMYDEVISRSSHFFAVGEGVRRTLLDSFPHHAGRISIIPNPVSFASVRATPVKDLRRWLYVGSLIERKGVLLLLEAFAACHHRDPALTLTMVGDGELRTRLAERAGELGVAAAVTFVGAVGPEDALRLMRQHDLLVHSSRYETFGMTVVEAVAAGMPVLITRCGGPEETLAGIEDAAGELVAVAETPDSITDGYWRLRARFPDGLDLDHARKMLASRYGYETYATVHGEVWFGQPPAVKVPLTGRSGGFHDD
jgi:glycogen(starch) synthase